MGRKKKDEPKTDREEMINFLNAFCENVAGHNTAWETMISNLSDQELEKFARLWAPAVEYALSRMEIYRIKEKWD
jgi:hypothetical protein